MQNVHPFAQYLVALAATVAAYGGYAAWVAPRIEGNPPHVEGISTATMELPADDRTQDGLGRWLPAGSWELGQCKTLRTEDTTLYFHDYVTLADGTVQIYPLTIVLGDDPADPGRVPLIIRAEEQALLQFDRPLQLGGENPGRLLAARMPGGVELLQPDAEGGSGTGLVVRTSNLQLTPQRIFTIEEVSFSRPGSSGSGRNLVIELAHSAPPGAINAGFATINGLSRMELAFVDHLDISADDSSPQGGGIATAPNSLQRARIQCRGPLVFDFHDQTARFQDQVVVRSLNGEGDMLSGDELQVVFDRLVDVDPNGSAIQSRRVGLPRLKPSRIIAAGKPARLELPSQQASAVAESLEYDLLQERIHARDSRAVIVRQAGHEFVTRSVEYGLREDRSLGTLLAEGPGSLVSVVESQSAGKPSRTWQVTFAEQMTIQPDAAGRLVTVSGAARVAMESGQEIAGQQIRLWLSQDRIAAGPGGSGEQWDYQPRRMEVDGDATVGMPGLQGLTQKLVAIWNGIPAQAAGGPETALPPRHNMQRLAGPLRLGQPPAPRFFPTAHAVSRPALPAPAPAPLAAPLVLLLPPPAGTGPAGRQPQRSMRFRSAAVTVHLQTLNGQTTVDQVELAGEVVVEQLEEAASPDTLPDRSLMITAGQIHLQPDGTGLWRAHVTDSAVVDSPQLVLRGEDLHLDQAANRMWVVGPGNLELKPAKAGSVPVQQASTGTPPAPRPVDAVNVSWAGGMIFDGSRVWFEQQVRSDGLQSRADGGRSQIRSLSAGLTLTLDQPVSFQEPRSEAGGPKVRELLLIHHLAAGQQVFETAANPGPADSPASVVLEKTDFSAGGDTSSRQVVVVPQVRVDLESGGILAEGSGGIVHWQPAGGGGGNPLFGTPPLPESPAGTPRISCLHVNFDRSLSASSEKGTVDIDGNVRAVFAEVDSWETQLQPDQPRPPAGATRMVCQHVRIVRWTPSGSESAMTELLATGDAVIQSSTFEARGTRVSYNQQSDMLILEGDSRTEANLWHASKPGAPRDHLVAGKIFYRPGDQWTQIEKVRSATINRNGQ